MLESRIDLLGGAIDLGVPPPYVPPGPTVEPEDKAVTSERERKAEIVRIGLERFKLAYTADKSQRERELEDLTFEGIDQWPELYRKARDGYVDAAGRAVPSRPCLTINKLDQPVQLVVNEARMAHLAVNIRPRGSGATREIADVRTGLIRAIQIDSRASIARLWALDRAVKCGRGFYRVRKVYANDGDFELDLTIERILNQHSVYLDPAAKQPDWSDGEWGFITSDITEDEHRRLYPDAELSLADTELLKSLGDNAPDWVSGEPGARTYRIAEYFRVVYEQRTLVFLEGIGKQWLEDVPQHLHPRIKRRRIVEQRKVKWVVMNAHEVLDEEDWEGRYIPIIPVVGKEYNIDGKRLWKGIVSNAKDAQRSYNVMRSEQVTIVGLTSKAPWVMAEGQDEGYEQQWDDANVKNYGRLIYKPTTFEGQLVPPPQRNTAEPAVQAVTLLVHEADNDIQATTGRFNPSLGKATSDRSGKAIKALQSQGETGSSNYLDSLATISMTYEGMILNDLLEYVYDTAGRIKRMIGDEDDEQAVMLNKPYMEGPDGTPQPLPDGMPFELGKHKLYNLKDGGQYGVVVEIGKSFPTRRAETASAMGELAQAAPALIPLVADIWVDNMDFAGAKKMAKRLKKANPAAKDDDEKGQPPIPPEAQQMIQEAQAKLQMAGQENQALKQMVQKDELKVKASVLIKREEFASREKLALLDARVKLMTTQANIEGKAALEGLRLEIERVEREADRMHDRLQQMSSQGHDVDLDVLEHSLTPAEPEVAAEGEIST